MSHNNKRSRNASGDRKTLLDFNFQVGEIEALLKKCIIEHHTPIQGYEVQTLIKEWKNLHTKLVGVGISEEEFSQTEIGKLIASHSIFERMEKLV